MPVRLLCVGDVHLGRSPGGLGPELLAELGLEARAVGPRAAWERTVDLALREQVDAVLLAGDVVDAERDYFESYAVLSAGVERLAAAGIRVLGVVGNHDVEVLPLLARNLPRFELLGPGGTWQLARIEGRAGGALEVVGWSFPQAQVQVSPLASFPSDLRGRGDVPRVGLLHADLDASPSVYAPVRSSDLSATGLDAWLLGHVHKPGDLSGPRPIGYLGSLSAVRASEIGDRGPWLLEAGAGGVRLAQRVLAPLRFEELLVDVSDVEGRGAAQERIQEVLERRAGELQRGALGGPGPLVVGLRMTLVGRSRDRQALFAAAQDAKLSAAVSARRGEPAVFLEGIEVAASNALDLATSAQRSDPLGLLARQLLLLARPADDPERRALIEAARPVLERRGEDVLRGKLDPPLLDMGAVAERLRRAGELLLDGLLRQEHEREGAT